MNDWPAKSMFDYLSIVFAFAGTVLFALKERYARRRGTPRPPKKNEGADPPAPS